MKKVIKQAKFILLSALCVIALAGWGIKTAEIRTDNGKALIDLDALLVSEKTGQSGSSDKGEQVDKNEEKEGEGSGKNPETQKPDSSITIAIRNKTIVCRGKSFTYNKETGCAEGFEEFVHTFAANDKVTIRDNYAEAHTYRYVVEKVKEVTSQVVLETPDLMKEGEG